MENAVNVVSSVVSDPTVQKVGAVRGEQTGGQRDEFMRFLNGNNLVRFVTAPHQYYLHTYKANEAEAGFGDRVPCSGPTHNGECTLCLLGSKPKRRWFAGVIDRATGAYKIADIGFTIYSKLKDYSDDPKFGNPIGYDVQIKKSLGGGPLNTYSVIAYGKEPLSSTDLKLVENIDVGVLARRCVPPEPTAVIARLNAARAKKNLAPVDFGTISIAAVKPTSAQSIKVDMTEEDYSFTQAD